MIDPYAQPEASTRSTPVHRLLGVASALLIVLGVAVAIGKDDSATDAPDDSSVALLSAAPDAARDAGSARLTVTTTGTSGVYVTGSGVIDFRTGNSEMTMAVAGAEMSMKVIDGVIFMKMPPLLALPKPWIKFSIPAGLLPEGGFSRSVGGSAAGFVDSLRGVGDVTDLGHETVNGVETTHYRVVIDVDRALDAVPEADRAEMEQSFGSIPPLRDMPMEVWLSDDGLPVRTEMKIDVGELDMTTRMDLTDFGVDVDVQPPPADQVIEITDIAEMTDLFSGSLTS